MSRDGYELTGYTEYEMITKDAEGEAHVHKLEARKYQLEDIREQIGELLVRRCVPTRIHPTKRQRPDGEFERHVFYGDTHHPFQDKRKIALANLLVRETMPSSVTYLGDDLDNALFSRFESRSEWLSSTQTGIDQFHDQLAQTRADIGSEGKIIVHEGNHNQRLEKKIREYNAELLGLKRANAAEELGVLTTQYLLRTNELDVEYVDGYPSALYAHSDRLVSFHSERKKSAAKMAVNFIHGHTHHASMQFHRWHDGRKELEIWGLEGGTFADREQIPSQKYATTAEGNKLIQPMNWQYGVWEVLSNEELDIPIWHPITDSGIMIEGKWYKS